SLTPQITGIFQSHFGNEVAILHSRLSVYDRYTAWKKILTHQVRIVIGARSAIFAPLDHLGIIIIDEEHEQSYIQDNNPKYNAIEIAKLRSQTHQCPLVLGSATPNVCDYYKAIEGEYELLSMPTRANKHPLPKKTLVDMREELKMGNKSVFSKSLQKRLVEVYKKNEQSILFLNRRGHSSFVMCRSCGEVIQCPHCDVSLTYHSGTNTLVCHHCGYKQMNVESCPSCGSSKIRFVGSGTEKVMEEIQNLLPEAKVLRVDLDTTSKIVDYESAFEKFKNHEADIMVGTQMIAKGLDFADVTLVGVVNADLALHYPSYASNMTAFNLIEQVSGRA
ncbi:MAG: primosomal protein N', partial [Anaeroplasmataceae bacterium]|nr:primosomal protein N' [Anaeroplasmataceae bacterium]